MRALISMLFIVLGGTGAAQPGYTAGFPISGKDANTLVMIFNQAGLRFEPSIESNRSFIGSNGIHCVLQIRAPGAAFIPNCSVLDRFNREFRVDERQLQALVNILTRAGIKPVSNDAETTLSTRGIDCQSVQVTPVTPVTSSCYLR